MKHMDRNTLQRLCVRSDATILEAMKALSAGQMGIVLVLDDEARVVGTVTDGDIRASLIRGGNIEMGVAEVMTRNFQRVQSDGNHRDRAMDLMVAYRIKQVPVIDDMGRLTGLHVLEEYLDPDPLPNWAVILAGGKGTRLRPLTESIPKPMVTVAGRPILERLVLGLVGEGVSRIFLSVNYMREVIVEHFGDGSAFGCQIEYLEEEQPLGTGGPLGILPEPPSEPLFLMNGDVISHFPVRSMLDHHASRRNAITMGVGVHSYEVPFGVVSVDGERVRMIEEKPRFNWLINHGAYVISPEVLQLVEPDVEFPVTDLIGQVLGRGDPVGHFEIEGDWIDVGRPADLKRARGR